MMKPLYLEYLDCPVQYATYDDFNKRFRLRRPACFNFAYDIADRIADAEPDRTAVLWTDESGACIRYTFGMLRQESDRAANLFQSLGFVKGDKVMLILRRHLQFWPILMALHKLGVVAVPATHLLTEKDIVYRVNAAGIKGAVITDKDPGVRASAENARAKCPTLTTLLVLRG
jgi:acetyl-CoA synthetase